MKGREAKAGPSADLLLCFPSRPHWTVTPKAICAPDDRRRHLRKSSTGAAGQVSPLLWAKAKSAASETAEPSSPKVTCSGQIKVRQNTSACSNCQSVMDEIEKIHDAGKQKKRSNWAESLRFKREIMQFLTCLRTLRFDMRCFGSFPTADNTAEDDDEEEEEECYRENHEGIEGTSDDAARAVFSKWFMMLQEKQNNVFQGEAATNEDDVSDDVSIAEPAVPPPNALLLMRSRSAPAKSWIKENEEQEKEDRARAEEGKEKDEQTSMQSMRLLMEKEEKKNENTRAMRYDSDFHCMSSDIVKESWMVGRLRDPSSKSQSWTR